jgi:hypothetical protein
MVTVKFSKTVGPAVSCRFLEFLEPENPLTPVPEDEVSFDHYN